MADSNGWWRISRSISTCCRRRCEKKSKARAPSGARPVVTRGVSGELCAGLSARPIWTCVVVSEESGQGPDRPAAAHSRSRAGPPPIRLSTNLGPSTARRLGGQPQAGAALVPPGGAPVAHARAATQTYCAASRPSPGASRSSGTVEYGFRA
jgi:hypothetical protein